MTEAAGGDCNWLRLLNQRYPFRTNRQHKSSLWQTSGPRTTKFSDNVDNVLEKSQFSILSFDVEYAAKEGSFPVAHKHPIVRITNTIVKNEDNNPFLKVVFTLHTCVCLPNVEVRIFKTERYLLHAWSEFIWQVDPDYFAENSVHDLAFDYVVKRSCYVGLQTLFKRVSRAFSNLDSCSMQKLRGIGRSFKGRLVAVSEDSLNADHQRENGCITNSASDSHVKCDGTTGFLREEVASLLDKIAFNMQDPHERQTALKLTCATSASINSTRACSQNTIAKRKSEVPDSQIPIFESIIKRFKNGIPLGEFCELYKQETGSEPPFSSWGFANLVEMFKSLHSIFIITAPDIRNEASFPGSCGDHILYGAGDPPRELLEFRRRSEYLTQRRTQNKTTMAESVMLRIIKILRDAGEGIHASDFGLLYRLTYKEDLLCSTWNYSTFYDMLTDLSLDLPIQICGVPGSWTVSLDEQSFKHWLLRCIKNRKSSVARILVSFPEDVVVPGESLITLQLPDESIHSEDSETCYWTPVMITCVLDPEWIWVHLKRERHNQALDHLMDSLKFYNNPEAQKYKIPNVLLTLDLVCAARFTGDKEWHRSRILKLDEKEEKATVLFLDYGGIDVVSYRDLMLLRREYAPLPAQAVVVSLKGIRSLDSHNPHRWTEDAQKLLLQFSNKNYYLACLFYKQIERNRYEVYLCDTNDAADVYLHQLLVEKGLAASYEVPEKEAEATAPQEIVSENCIPMSDPLSFWWLDFIKNMDLSALETTANLTA